VIVGGYCPDRGLEQVPQPSGYASAAAHNRGHAHALMFIARAGTPRCLAAAEDGTTASLADIDNPVTMVRTPGAELLNLLRTEC